MDPESGLPVVIDRVYALKDRPRSQTRQVREASILGLGFRMEGMERLGRGTLVNDWQGHVGPHSLQDYPVLNSAAISGV